MKGPTESGDDCQRPACPPTVRHFFALLHAPSLSRAEYTSMAMILIVENFLYFHASVMKSSEKTGPVLEQKRADKGAQGIAEYTHQHPGRHQVLPTLGSRERRRCRRSQNRRVGGGN